MTNEYKGTVGSSGCTYKSLCNYDTRRMGLYAEGTPSMAVQVVPDWPYGPDYKALTHGGATSGCGYFNIKDAYNYGCKWPIPFRKRPCAGGCPGDEPMNPLPTTREEKMRFAGQLVDTTLGLTGVAKSCLANYITDIWTDQDWRSAMVLGKDDLIKAVQAAAVFSGCVKM